ncbi:MAG TPA: prenyltransferase/squalene oxidase repeat-containing protein, partial [Planctomycetota bacterium]|nr:prenyltransferase/squalene oxidase repeat-containing protein [Planctomycetota bacterium]
MRVDKVLLAATVAAAFVLGGGGDPRAQDHGPLTLAESEVTPAARRSIQIGIKWLIANQNPDGSWGCERGQPPSVALTSLSVLVLMADGSTPERGPHSTQIRRALKWIDHNKTRGGLMSAYDSTAMGEVFEHACGTLMLATLYGMAQHKEVGEEKEKLGGLLKDALEKLSKLQVEDGGFGKNVRGSSDPGVSAMAYLALRTGYACGITKAQANLGKLKDYGRALVTGSGG